MFKIKIIVCGWQRLVWTSHKYSGRDGVNQQLGRGRISDGGNYPQICPHRALATSSVKIKHRFSLQLTFIHPTAPLYVHPLNRCQKINNCFVLSTEKGNTSQPKSCQDYSETCNYTILFHALSHLQSWMAGRQSFPRDSWTCSCVCPPPPLPPPCQLLQINRANVT